MTGATMIGKPRRAWAWFVEGLAEALLGGIDALTRAKPYRLEIADAGAVLFGPDGTRIGRLPGGTGPAGLEPPGIGRRLAGASLDVVIPPAWEFRRGLDPVAVQSRPFLDAFVRHQIERITPWRVADVHYRVFDEPLAEDANRLAVTVAVVPKRLVARWLSPLDDLRLRSIRLRAAGSAPSARTGIDLGQDRSPLVPRLRRWVARGLMGGALLVLTLVGGLEWQAGLVRGDIAEQDRVLGERKAVLAKARHRDDPAGDAGAKIRQLREGRPSAVAVIDALSAAVPDSAHLTSLAIDKDHVTVAGVSTDPSGLVPALETSGFFADVAFGTATTRVETGAGDRFGLEMRALARPRPPVTAPGLSLADRPGSGEGRP